MSRNHTPSRQFGMLAAVALATILSSCITSPPPGSPDKEGMCHGANSCKGKAQCGSTGSTCAGKNACRGKGWIKLARAKCEIAKGRFSTDFHE